jgi:hypothetical protein
MVAKQFKGEPLRVDLEIDKKDNIITFNLVHEFSSEKEVAKLFNVFSNSEKDDINEIGLNTIQSVMKSINGGIGLLRENPSVYGIYVPIVKN